MTADQPTLAELLDSLADAAGADRRTADETTEYVGGDVVFALRTERTASFRLDPAIVRAAVRTPDTKASARGGEWLEITPGALDRFTVDRLTAWFEAAQRRAIAPEIV